MIYLLHLGEYYTAYAVYNDHTLVKAQRVTLTDGTPYYPARFRKYNDYVLLLGEGIMGSSIKFTLAKLNSTGDIVNFMLITNFNSFDTYSEPEGQYYNVFSANNPSDDTIEFTL
jgi:hypothetical protein